MTNGCTRRSVVGVGLCVGLGSTSWAQVRDIFDAVNKAGRERTLIQRMGKAYLAMGQNVQPDAAKKVLADSMAAFDRSLVELRAFAPTPAIQAQFKRVDSEWSDYKTALVGKAPSKEGAPVVVAGATKVLAEATKASDLLVAHSGQTAARIVSLSGGQRMHSQAMAKFYFASAWGVDAKAAGAEMNKARESFLAAHKALTTAAETTPPILAQLRQAESQFTFFDTALTRTTGTSPSAANLRDVFTTSERVLQIMDGVTDMYTRLKA
jgi:Type IV pili methyl-accepting chemotaxis transducer N-term